MKKLLLILAFVTLFSSSSFVQAQIPDDKRQEIEKMLKLNDTEKMINQMTVRLIDTLKTRSPQVSVDFLVRFQAKLDTHALIEKLMPAYDKHYSLDGLKAINAFYSSPVGQKLLASVPQDSLRIGPEWLAPALEQAVKEIETEK